jgi:hypothetical protein
MDVAPFPRIRPFTKPPLTWNTYTALDAPLLDGGPYFVPFAMALFGLILGALWTLATSRGAGAWRPLYAILSVAVVTSTGSNNFAAPYLLGAAALTVILLAAASRWPTREAPARDGRRAPGHRRIRMWRWGLG